MLTKLKSNTPNVLVYEINDFITETEIDSIEKDIEKVLEKHEKVNLMLHVNVMGENLKAFLKEFQVGIEFWNKINQIAYIGEKSKFWEALIALDNLFTKFKEKYFSIDEVEDAWEWLNKN